jgi:hypothetical protein
MGSQLFQLPKAVPLDSNADLYAGAKAYFYVTGTSTPQNTYQDANLTIPHAHPVVADGFGRFPVVYLDPTKAYKLTMTTSAGVALPDFADPVNDQILSGSVIGGFIYPATTAETATGLTLSLQYPYGDLRRFGIVANDLSAATNNSTYFAALTSPTVAGPVGDFYLPNVTGSDIYHFNKFVDVRPGIRIYLLGSEMRCTKTFSAGTDNGRGFLNFLRDGGIVGPGIVRLDCDTTGGDGAGAVIRVGSRTGRPYGQWTAGVFDKTDLIDQGLAPMGNLDFIGLTIKSNNPAVSMLEAFGGLVGWRMINVTFDGLGLAPAGPLYEFGFATKNGSVDDEDWTSSHATQVVWENIVAKNFSGAAGWSSGEMTGVWDAEVVNFTGLDSQYGFSFRPGEALYYRPWTPHGTTGKRHLRMRGMRIFDCDNGLQLKGAESSSGGYLAAEGLTEAQQVDLMKFSLDGFEIKGNGTTGSGLIVSGPCDASNGSVVDFFNNLVIGDECVQFKFSNCDFVDAADIGVRGNFGDKIFATARKKIGTIEQCFIAGSVGVGLSLGNTSSVHVKNCRFGHSTAFNGLTESDQTHSVGLASTANGCVLESNHSTIKAGGGGVSYDSAGTSDRGNNIVNPQGDVTSTANVFQIDGVSRTTQAALQSIAHEINTVGKYAGKRAWDTTNTRLMIAEGSTAGSVWRVVDNSATFTPV